jgi:hypothetical protein
LFFTAYEIALSRAKPKGRAVYHEPMEWSGLLWCCNHDEPALVSSYSSGGVHRCKRDYDSARGRICLNIEKRFIDEPLTTEVLRQLDFTPFTEEVLEQLETEAERGKLATARSRQEIAELERRLESLKQYLGCGDKQREEIYWQQYQSTDEKLRQLQSNPVTEKAIADIDIETVKQFLINLPVKWKNYSPSVRNRLLKLIIEKTELRHDAKTIEATVFWKTGFRQQIVIQRARAAFSEDNLWTDKEDKILETLWPNSSLEAVLEALPKRTLSAVKNHARCLGLKRRRKPDSATIQHRWTKLEQSQTRKLYEGGASVPEIALKLNLTPASIVQHAKAGKWNRPPWAKQRKKPVIWKVMEQNFKGFQSEPSQKHFPSPASKNSAWHDNTGWRGARGEVYGSIARSSRLLITMPASGPGSGVTGSVRVNSPFCIHDFSACAISTAFG